MTSLVVIEKATGRLMFVKDAGVPVLLDGLWSAVTHNYLHTPDANVSAEVRNAPYLWTWIGRSPERSPPTSEEARRCELNRQRGELLMVLARAINRRRRLGSKQVVGQLQIYAFKVDEAQRFRRLGPAEGPYPFLEDAAEIDNITVGQASDLVLMRYAQEIQVLRETEVQRITFSRRVLLAVDDAAFRRLEADLMRYERNG